MRILILNWKDIRHPEAGGAEIVTHQYANHLVKSGHQVTLFTSSFRNASVEESIDGVRILRKGTIYTVHLWAAYMFLVHLKHETDLVIDQFHGIPFFTPLYVRKPILAWIHEVAGDIWRKEFPFPVAAIGMLMEKLYFLLYRKSTFLTDTKSTKNELTACGIPKSSIQVIPLTIDLPEKVGQKKTRQPLLVYVGRLTPMKRLEYLMEAISLLTLQFPRLRALVVGNSKPQYIKTLTHLISKLSLSEYIQFTGQVSESQKYSLLARSWLNVQPSLKEGFGLTVLEAAAVGTPTVCFRVAGLKEVVTEGKNGWLVTEETPQALAEEISALLKNPRLLQKLSRSAYVWSKTLPDWTTQTRKLERLLKTIYR